VPLSPLHFLAAVVTTLLSAHPGRFHRLAVDDASAGLRVPVEANPNPLAQGGVQLFPGPVQAEASEVMVDDAPGREVVRNQAPRTAAPHHVEDGVEDLAQRVDSRASGGFGSGKVRLKAAPFGIGKIC
jgi:pimeloyl-ACP methyl ester carboxylesterase